MSLDATSLYQSSNGDHWSLMHDSESDHRFVRHEANPSSGRHISDIELSEALVQTPHRCDFADSQTIESLGGYRCNVRHKMLFAPEPFMARSFPDR